MDLRTCGSDDLLLAARLAPVPGTLPVHRNFAQTGYQESVKFRAGTEQPKTSRIEHPFSASRAQVEKLLPAGKTHVDRMRDEWSARW